jgi:hypothetical protein
VICGASLSNILHLSLSSLSERRQPVGVVTHKSRPHPFLLRPSLYDFSSLSFCSKCTLKSFRKIANQQYLLCYTSLVNKTPKASYFILIAFAVLATIAFLGVFDSKDKPQLKEEKVSVVEESDIRALPLLASKGEVVARLGEPSRVNTAKRKTFSRKRVLYRYSVKLGDKQSNRCRYYKKGRWTICFRDDFVTLVFTERSRYIPSTMTGYGLLKEMSKDVNLPSSVVSESWRLSKGPRLYRYLARIHKGGRCSKDSRGRTSWRYCFRANRLASVSFLLEKDGGAQSLDQLFKKNPSSTLPRKKFLTKALLSNQPISLGIYRSSKCLNYETRDSQDIVNDWMLCFKGGRLTSKERLAKAGQKRLAISIPKRS